jgi:ribose transport system ATP-binding protein
MKNIVKRFPGVLALDHVNLGIRKGEVLALIGENGAGKSTIIKILSGAYVPDEGEIFINGQPTLISSPDQAQQLGINTIHQESTLAPDLTAIQNIFLGRELRKKIFGRYGMVLDEREMERRALSLGENFDLDKGDFYRPVEQLGALKQHVVEMLKALAFDAELVIMDEPTAALTDHEREALFNHMRRLRDQGISILWVTHRLEELYGLADRASVLRDGRYIGTVEVSSAETSGLVRMMVGRDVESLEELSANQVSHTDSQSGRTEVLRVENVSRAGVLKDISFTLYEGEILGIGGLAGAGRTELARAILGADKMDSGTFYLEGRPIKVRSPKDAFRQGIALVPEERKVQGIFADFSVAKNISAAALWKVLRAGFLIDKKRENDTARGYVDELGIRTPSIQQKIGFLSGGNQQKAILARCLFAKPKVLILDEPTQGIDVGAKLEVYRLVNDYVRDGGAAIVISSELPELLGVSDRIMVLREGHKAGELQELKTGRTAGEQTRTLKEKVMSLATGGE